MINMALIWSEVISLSIFSSFIAAIVMGLAYAFGQITQNPRYLVWAKTEIFQVIVSIAIVFIIVFLVGLVGLDSGAGLTLDYGLLKALAPDSSTYSHPAISDSSNVFETADAYLTNLAYFSHHSVRASRTLMGAAEEMSKYGRSPCVPPWLLCLIGNNGVNARPVAGVAALSQASNLLMYTSTSAYLTILAQIFFLKFIQSGALAIYLPLAIVLRSLPFMRPFGGGLLAICISLFLLYPTLLYIESTFWDPWDWISEDGDTLSWDWIDNFVNGVEGKEDALSYGGVFMQGGNWNPLKGDSEDSFSAILTAYEHILRAASASFLSATFLFTFNIITISASAMLFARLLGSEVDMSRLVQIV